jgi:hypothetical protein
MTRKQEAYNSMIYKVIEEMKRKSELWIENKSISNVVEKIEETLGKIEEINTKQKITSAGATKQKTKIRKQLDKLTNVFYGSFRSYARSIDNVQLYEKYDFTITEIKQVKDTEVLGENNAVIVFATENLEKLKDFGTTQEIIDNYKIFAANFKEVLALPQTIIAERKTFTQKLKDLFKQIDEMLNEDLDNYMMQFITKNPDFYSDYENARIIYDSATISKSLMGIVTNAHEPVHVLQYVKVTIKFHPGSDLSGNVKTAASTTKKGNYQFKSLPEGVCTVTFSKNKYQTQTIETEIHKNTMTRLNVQMQNLEE